MASDTLEIHKVYNVDMESWIYELDGVFFDIVSDFGMRSDFSIEFYHRINKHTYIVTAEALENDCYPGYVGKPGDKIYDYEWRKTIAKDGVAAFLEITHDEIEFLEASCGFWYGDNEPKVEYVKVLFKTEN